MKHKTKPIKIPKEIQQNSDEHIDQDFPGFPYAPSTKKQITPTTIDEKIAASVIVLPTQENKQQEEE